jgi:hypothetical protein
MPRRSFVPIASDCLSVRLTISFAWSAIARHPTRIEVVEQPTLHQQTVDLIAWHMLAAPKPCPLLKHPWATSTTIEVHGCRCLIGFDDMNMTSPASFRRNPMPIDPFRPSIGAVDPAVATDGVQCPKRAKGGRRLAGEGSIGWAGDRSMRLHHSTLHSCVL